jgi:hypothetical protein
MSTNTYTDPVFTTELREWIQNDTEEYEYVPEWRPFSGGWNEKLHRDVFTFKGHKHTEELKKAQSKRMSGKNNPMSGKKHSPETIRKISLAKMGNQCAKKTAK